MNEKIVIAVDAMGGENSPNKIIDGIKLVLKSNSNLYFNLFGKSDQINDLISNNDLLNEKCQIINSELVINDNESPLQAAKKNDKSSMWQAISSVKNKESQIALSAGNTGALLILSKMILEMIEGIDKPALAGLWPNKKGMNIVLDLGANIECSDKNLIDFTYMGSSLYKSLFPELMPKIAILNVGSEEIKGHDEIKKAYKFLKENKVNDFEFMGYISWFKWSYCKESWSY